MRSYSLPSAYTLTPSRCDSMQFTRQVISGTVLVNGVPQDPVTFSRIAGYVEQFDSHESTSTVREAVEVSARLRLPSSTGEDEVKQKVDRVLAALGLTHLQDLRIGAIGEGGVSPEVRKKVTIAVELIMNPSLLFLDEPTTGLDAPGAFSVMKAVQELAREISVVCTIHQPSAEIVSMFDGLLLMKSGGEVAYSGALTELPTYFAEQRLGIYEEGQNMGGFGPSLLACVVPASQPGLACPIQCGKELELVFCLLTCVWHINCFYHCGPEARWKQHRARVPLVESVA